MSKQTKKYISARLQINRPVFFRSALKSIISNFHANKRGSNIGLGVHFSGLKKFK